MLRVARFAGRALVASRPSRACRASRPFGRRSLTRSRPQVRPLEGRALSLRAQMHGLRKWRRERVDGRALRKEVHATKRPCVAVRFCDFVFVAREKNGAGRRS